MNPNNPYGYGQSSLPPAPRPIHVTNTGVRSWPFFIGGEGIEHRVLQTDICRYLGNDARMKRGEFEGTDGYFYNAYRTFTHHMIDSLKEDSTKWWDEKRYSNSDDYHTSNTFRDSHQHDTFKTAQPPPFHDPPQPLNQIQLPPVNSRYQHTHDGSRFHDNYQSQFVAPSGPLPGGARRLELYHPSTGGDQNLATQVAPAMHSELSGDPLHPASGVQWQPHQPDDRTVPRNLPPQDPLMEGRHDRPPPRNPTQDPLMENRHDRPPPHGLPPQDPLVENRHDRPAPQHQPQDPLMENRHDRQIPRPHQPRQEYYSRQGGR